MTIAEENAKYLRQAMDVLVFVDETVEKPVSVTKTGFLTGYSANERVTEEGDAVQLMDFANGGFYLNGKANPITSGTLPDGSKYGFISSSMCGSDGSFATAPTVTIESDTEWDYVTLFLRDSKGNQSVESYTGLTWADEKTTVTIPNFTPNERLIVTKVALGKSWMFDNDTLTDLSAVLRGVNCDLEDGTFSLEASEISFNAYIGLSGDQYIDVFSRMDKNSPITFMCGYKDDMSAGRRFYLNDFEYDVENRKLKISGYDKTPIALDGDTSGNFVASTYATVRQDYYDVIKSILTNSGVTLTESGTVPSGSGSTVSNLFFDVNGKRDTIAQAVILNRDADRFALTYRDAGIPELIAGSVDTEWEINEEDVSSFKTEIEKNVKTYQADIYSYSASSEDEEVATQTGAVSGQIYFIDSSDPLKSVSTTGCSLVTPYTIKLVAATSGDITIYGKKIIKSTMSSNNPYTATDASKKGITVELPDMQIAQCDTSSGSLTKDGISDLLGGFNIKYSFTWRGNPHVKPWDLVRMKRLSEGGEFPSNYLYPGESLYPADGGEVLMRITSVSLDFSEGGGLTSQIEARKVM